MHKRKEQAVEFPARRPSIRIGRLVDRGFGRQHLLFQLVALLV
jgi:hypothetical protein